VPDDGAALARARWYFTVNLTVIARGQNCCTSEHGADS
jgi:hypothetical protein